MGAGCAEAQTPDAYQVLDIQRRCYRVCWKVQPNFAELAEIDKEDNRAPRRVPEVLALIGLGLRGPGEGDEPAVPDEELKALLEHSVDRLAEAEHDGRMEHREKTAGVTPRNATTRASCIPTCDPTSNCRSRRRARTATASAITPTSLRAPNTGSCGWDNA